MKFIQRFVTWLGPARAQVFFVLLAVTGLISLILNAVRGKDTSWIPAVQSGAFVVFLIGAALIVITRMDRQDRRRGVVIIVPAVFALAAALFLPSFWLLFVPFAIGWVFIAFIASQGRVRQEYQTAIKHLRKDEYDQAIDVMSDLIKAEPEDANHRRFRAELYRLSGKVFRARSDYEKLIELEPTSGIGYNGLAEVYLQDGEYEQALGYAQKAFEIEADQWVAPYNLGMIEDRLRHTADSITHLQQALKVGIPDSRHRLLAHLWLARAYVRDGDAANADAELAAMKRERTGLGEWKTVFESKQAAVLRDVLLDDVTLAEKLIEGEESLTILRST